ncbi:hypothetical protein PUMCH_004444 [Australozyma saopauloensis]|uniref:DUF3835 domain-containing protein n=1 Tax=Australozyma saopauloensis TaxID=291208 RepID=A0AAX4HGS5_9ASCO|nr:hypothetical protein PUMCH_004444 [[Candida] saopauloensis]
MAESLEELKEVLLLSIKALEEEKSLFEHANAVLNAQLSQIPETPSHKQIVFIGSDLWVEMTGDEARGFFGRRLDSNLADLKNISEKMQRSRQMLDSIGKVLDQENNVEQTEELNSEGLPIMDIQETLDDDGEVISATVNDKAFEAMPKDLLKELLAAEDQMEVAETQKGLSDSSAENENDGQIEELLADMEIIPRENPSESGESRKESKINEMETSDSEDELEDIQPSIRPEEIYELELIASEMDLDDPEDDVLEEGDFDYDIEDSDFNSDDHEGGDDSNGDLDDDSDDDSKADELLYGNNFGMFKGKSELQNRLWGEVQALRNKKIQSEPAPVEAKAPKKSVRFNESTEVKEIENVSESLKKIEHKKQKPLRFRERLILSGKTELKSEASRPDDDSEEVTRDIVDRSG